MNIAVLLADHQVAGDPTDWKGLFLGLGCFALIAWLAWLFFKNMEL